LKERRNKKQQRGYAPRLYKTVTGNKKNPEGKEKKKRGERTEKGTRLFFDADQKGKVSISGRG